MHSNARRKLIVSKKERKKLARVVFLTKRFDENFFLFEIDCCPELEIEKNYFTCDYGGLEIRVRYFVCVPVFVELWGNENWQFGITDAL